MGIGKLLEMVMVVVVKVLELILLQHFIGGNHNETNCQQTMTIDYGDTYVVQLFTLVQCTTVLKRHFDREEKCQRTISSRDEWRNMITPVCAMKYCLESISISIIDLYGFKTLLL